MDTIQSQAYNEITAPHVRQIVRNDEVKEDYDDDDSYVGMEPY